MKVRVSMYCTSIGQSKQESPTVATHNQYCRFLPQSKIKALQYIVGSTSDPHTYYAYHT
jgi:hypothetical protein